jgi:hypothetical protein
MRLSRSTPYRWLRDFEGSYIYLHLHHFLRVFLSVMAEVLTALDTMDRESFSGKWCVLLSCVSTSLWASWIGGYHGNRLIMHPISIMMLMFK